MHSKSLSVTVVFLTHALAALAATSAPVRAQMPPTAEEYRAYEGLFGAVTRGSAAEIDDRVKDGENVRVRDGNGRTPLIVAAFRHDTAVAKALLDAGADPNALDYQSYDALTIAAAAGDAGMVKLLLAAGASPRAITGPYGGTALIAAAHAGHPHVVQLLLDARAPVNHVNNLGHTALIEAIVLGDGREPYQKIVDALVRAEADVNLADRNGATPVQLARAKDYAEIARILEAAGARRDSDARATSP